MVGLSIRRSGNDQLLTIDDVDTHPARMVLSKS